MAYGDYQNKYGRTKTRTKYTPSVRRSGGGGATPTATRATGGGKRRGGGSAFDNSDSRFPWKKFMKQAQDTGVEGDYTPDVGTGVYGEEPEDMLEMAMGGAPEPGSPEDLEMMIAAMQAAENPMDYEMPEQAPRLAYGGGMEGMRGMSMPQLQALPQLAAYQTAQPPVTQEPKAKQPLSTDKPVKTIPTMEDTALPGTIETLKALSNLTRGTQGLGPWMGPQGGYGGGEPLLDKVLRDIALQRGNDFAVPEGYNPGARPPGIVDYLKDTFSRQTPPAPEIAGQGYEFVPQMPNDFTRPGEARLVQYGAPQKDVNTRGKEEPGSANPSDKNFTGNLPRNYGDDFSKVQNTLNDVAFGRGQYKGNIYNGPPNSYLRWEENMFGPGDELPFNKPNRGYYQSEEMPMNLPFATPSPQQKIQDILTPAPLKTPIETLGNPMQGLLNTQAEEQRRREEEERRRRELELQMQMQQQGGLGGFGGFGGGGSGGGGGVESLLGGWTL